MFYNDTDATIRQRIVEQIDAEAESIKDEKEREDFRMAAQKAWNARHNVNGQILEWNRDHYHKGYYSDSAYVVCRRSGTIHQILLKATGKDLSEEVLHADFMVTKLADRIRQVYERIGAENAQVIEGRRFNAYHAWIERKRQADPANPRYQPRKKLNVGHSADLWREFLDETHYQDEDVLPMAKREDLEELDRLHVRYEEAYEKLVDLQTRYAITDSMIIVSHRIESLGKYYLTDPMSGDRMEEQPITRRRVTIRVDFLDRGPIKLDGVHEPDPIKFSELIGPLR